MGGNPNHTHFLPRKYSNQKPAKINIVHQIGYCGGCSLFLPSNWDQAISFGS